MPAFPTRRILGVDFFIGPLDAAVDQALLPPSSPVTSYQLPAPSHQSPATSPQPLAPTPLVTSYQPPVTSHQPPAPRPQLIVAPSAPGLAVDLVHSPAYRQALQTADLVLTDSGFMVLLWWLFTGERLPRHSGLKFLRAVLARPELKQPGAIFWVMPSVAEAERNQTWLLAQGFPVTPADIYIAPAYSAIGDLSDPVLLERLKTRAPRVIMLAIGGGVQERLGLTLRAQLLATSSLAPSPLVTRNQPPTTSPQPPAPSAECPAPSSQRPAPPLQSLAPSLLATSHQPPAAILCLGAAIAFLTGGQANIPPWADKLILGWLLRLLSNPKKFWRRYWDALRLVSLLWHSRERTPSVQ